jgi:hypothetical protein
MSRSKREKGNPLANLMYGRIEGEGSVRGNSVRFVSKISFDLDRKSGLSAAVCSDEQE